MKSKAVGFSLDKPDINADKEKGESSIFGVSEIEEKRISEDKSDNDNPDSISNLNK